VKESEDDVMAKETLCHFCYNLRFTCYCDAIMKDNIGAPLKARPLVTVEETDENIGIMEI